MKALKPGRNRNRRRMTLGERVRELLAGSWRRGAAIAAGRGEERAASRSARRTEAVEAENGPPGWSGALFGVAAWVLPLVVGVAAFAAPLLGERAFRYVMATGHFHVGEVLVSGNQRVDYATIQELAEIVPGTHVLSADLAAMETKLVAHRWVAWASVTRELPDRLLVRIVEHEPVAYVALGELWIVDAGGERFAPVGPGDDMALPIVTGLGPDALDDPLEADEARARIRSAVNLARLYEALGFGARWPLSEVRIEPGGHMTVVLSGIGTEAVLGGEPYREKLYRLEWILESLHQQGKVAEYVLLDNHPEGDWRRDQGRVVVKADVAPTRDELARRAAERAEDAQRRWDEMKRAEEAAAAVEQAPGDPRLPFAAGPGLFEVLDRLKAAGGNEDQGAPAGVEVEVGGHGSQDGE